MGNWRQNSEYNKQHLKKGDFVICHYKAVFVGIVEDIITSGSYGAMYQVKKTHDLYLDEQKGHRRKYSGAYLTRIDKRFVERLDEIRKESDKTQLDLIFKQKK